MAHNNDLQSYRNGGNLNALNNSVT